MRRHQIAGSFGDGVRAAPNLLAAIEQAGHRGGKASVRGPRGGGGVLSGDDEEAGGEHDCETEQRVTTFGDGQRLQLSQVV